MAQASLKKTSSARASSSHPPKTVAPAAPASEPTVGHPAAELNSKKRKRTSSRGSGKKHATTKLDNKVERRTRINSNINNEQQPLTCGLRGRYYIDPVCLSPVPVDAGFIIPYTPVSDVTTSMKEDEFRATLCKYRATKPVFVSPLSAIIAIRINTALTDIEKRMLEQNVREFYSLDSAKYDTDVRDSQAQVAMAQGDLVALCIALQPSGHDKAHRDGVVRYKKLEARKSNRRVKRHKSSAMDTEKPAATASHTDEDDDSLSGSESCSSGSDADDGDADEGTASRDVQEAEAEAAFAKVDKVVAAAEKPSPAGGRRRV